jgi:hypothetical protein
MRSPFRLFLGLLLALCFAVGQQLALRHALSHAADAVAQKGDSRIPKVACDQCALTGQPPATPVAGMPPVAGIDGLVAAAPCAQIDAPARVHLVFRSRAPPVLL